MTDMTHTRHTRLFLALEPRFMFDAAGMATADDVADNVAHDPQGYFQPDTAVDHSVAEALIQGPAAASTTSTTREPALQVVRAADPGLNSGRKEVAFIDPTVAGFQTLVNDMRAGVEVVVLDSHRDGLTQMAEWARTHSGYDVLHVLSQGSEGEVHLGTLTLDRATLTTRTADLQAVGAALTTNGDLLLYGSEVAKDAAGQRFIADLASATGADVAASADLTGLASQGEGWTLETSSGTVESRSAFVAVREADPSKVDGRKEVAFVDTSLADYRVLEAGIRDGVEIVEIDGRQSGLAQMARWAETHEGYDAIHVLSHGLESTLQIGADAINDGALATPAVQAELAQIGRSLKAGGDLLLYGCDIGGGSEAQRFLDNLAAATGADVAASADVTGSAALGGDWTLERTARQTDDVDPRSVLNLSDYDNVLATSLSAEGTVPSLTRYQNVGSVSTAYVVGDADGNIWLREQTENDTYTFKKWDGSSWSSVTSFTRADVGLTTFTWQDDCSMTVDSQGRLHMVVAGSNNGTHYVKYGLFDGSAWSFSTVNSGASRLDFTRIAVDSSGNPVVAYFGDGYVRFSTYDNGTWTAHTVLSGVGIEDGYHDCFVRPDGKILVVTIENYVRKVRTYSSAGVLESTTPSLNSYDPTGIAVDSSGNLHIMSWSGTEFRYYTSENSYSTYEVVPVTVPSGGYLDVAAYCVGQTRSGSLVVSNNGDKYFLVKVFDGDGVGTLQIVTKMADGTWVAGKDDITTLNGFLSDTVNNTGLSLAIDTNDKIMVINTQDTGTATQYVYDLNVDYMNASAPTIGVISAISEDSTSGTSVTITRADGATTKLKITDITGGKLYSDAGHTTEITGGTFIDAGASNTVYFVPTANFNGTASFKVQGASAAADASLIGIAKTASITVNAVADTPSVESFTGGSAIQEDSGARSVVITRSANDGAEDTYYKIGSITGGRLYSDSGLTTEITAASPWLASAGASTTVYFVPTANYNGTASFTVQAATSNADGSLGGSTATSTITVTSVNDAPTNSVAPSFSGTATVGQQLTAATGTWSDADNDTLSYSYKWYRADDASGTNEAEISGATASTYTLTSSDAGKYLKVQVTASDGTASASASSGRSLVSAAASTFHGVTGTTVALYTSLFDPDSPGGATPAISFGVDDSTTNGVSYDLDDGGTLYEFNPTTQTLTMSLTLGMVFTNDISFEFSGGSLDNFTSFTLDTAASTSSHKSYITPSYDGKVLQLNIEDSHFWVGETTASGATLVFNFTSVDASTSSGITGTTVDVHSTVNPSNSWGTVAVDDDDIEFTFGSLMINFNPTTNKLTFTTPPDNGFSFTESFEFEFSGGNIDHFTSISLAPESTDSLAGGFNISYSGKKLIFTLKNGVTQYDVGWAYNAIYDFTSVDVSGASGGSIIFNAQNLATQTTTLGGTNYTEATNTDFNDGVATDGEGGSADIAGYTIDIYPVDAQGSNKTTTGSGTLELAGNGVTSTSSGQEVSLWNVGVPLGVSYVEDGNIPFKAWVIEERSGEEFSLQSFKFAEMFGNSYEYTVEGFRDGVSIGTVTFTTTSDATFKTASLANGLLDSTFHNVDQVKIYLTDSTLEVFSPATPGQDLTVLNNIEIGDPIVANTAPTLTTISTLTGGTEDTAYAISYADLAAAADEADTDGDTLSFRVEAVSSGTLYTDAALTTPVTAGTTTLSSGGTWYWKPAADANGTLDAFTVKAHDGTDASSTAIQVQVTVGAVNDAPAISGTPSISGTLTVGQQLTAVTGTWSDAESQSISYSYQWYRADDSGGTNEAAISGATGSTYTLTTSDAHKYIKVQVTASDGNGGSASASSSRSAVSNSAPGNSVTPAVSGTFAVGQSLTADSGTWTDADGDGRTYSYQWYRAGTSGGSYSAITGATSASYTLTASDAHQYVKVVVTANDGHGSSTQTAASTPAQVANAVPGNSVAPTITGTATVGNTLTAGTGTWSDGDGDSLTYSYQWYRASTSGGTYTAITGATSQTYTLTTSDAHQYVKVVVTANDGNGSADQTATSLATQITNSAPANTVAPTISGTVAVGQSLTAGTGTWSDGDGDSPTYTYQWYRADDAGGTNATAISGATASTYTVTTSDTGKYIQVKVTADDGNGSSTQNASSSYHQVVNGPPTNSVAPTVSGTAAIGNTLTAAAGTWSDGDNDTITYSYQWYRADDAGGTNLTAIGGATGTSYTLTASDVHKYIKVVETASDGQGHSPTAGSSYSQAANRAPASSVAPAVSGTATVGNALTATTGTWSDGDGDSLTYTYQWYRADDADGINAAAISGATSQTYTLTTSDAHQYVKVVVTANDGHGSSTQTAQSGYTQVTNTAPANSVAPSITGTVAVGNALSTTTGTWSDGDGDSLTYTYQWYRADDAGGTSAAAISGATSASYTLTPSDAHQYVKVVVTANDGHGSTTQTAASSWQALSNSAPTNSVAPALSGNALLTCALSAGTGTWSDGDGDSLTYSYQWYRADDAGGTNLTAIGGATGTSYTLTASDVQKYVKVVVTANDGHGSATQTASSSYTTAVLDAPAVSSVSVPSTGIYRTGTTLDFTVNFSGAVNVTGTPRLALTVGTSTVHADYVSGSGTSALVFRHTVASGELDTDGIAVGSLSLNSGTIRDANAVDAVLTLNSVGSTSLVRVDAVAPAVSSVTAPSDGSYAAGQALDFTVTFAETVVVDATSGTPSLPLRLDTGGTVAASYVSGSGTSALLFRHTVVSGNLDLTGVALGSAITLNSGIIKDAAGNAATPTLNNVASTSAVLVDTAAPSAPSTPDLAAATDSGSSSTDNLTNSAPGTFTGTAEAGATVRLYSGDTLLGTTTAGSNGVWSVSVTLSEGSPSIRAQAVDAAGNESALSSALAIVVDRSAPNLGDVDLAAVSDTGSDDNDNLTRIRTPTLTGTAEAAGTVKVYDGSTLVGTAVAGSDGRWTLVTSDLSTGAHSLMFTATDAAGNTATLSGALTVTIDSTAPGTPGTPDLTAASDTGTSDRDNITASTTPTLTGTAEANAIVKVYDNTRLVGTTTAGSDGQWTLIPSLDPGTRSIAVTATDAAGNISGLSSRLSLLIDTSAPATPSQPDLIVGHDSGASASDNVTKITNPAFVGTAEAGATVRLYSGSTLVGTATAGTDGRWEITATSLPEGSQALTATATDTAGNTSAVGSALAVRIDTMAPAAPSGPDLATASDTGTSDSDNVTRTARPVISGSAEAGSTVRLYDGDALIATTVAGSDGSWRVTTPALGDGSHALRAIATDAAGNLSTPGEALNLVVDTTAPAAPDMPDLAAASDTGASDSDNITSVTAPTLTGIAEAGATVRLYDGTRLVGTTTAGTDGRWTLLPSLGNGTHQLSATATDVAGNVSAGGARLTVTIDSQNPAVPSGLALAAASDTGASNRDSITRLTTPTLTGTAEPGATVKVYDGETLLGTTTAGGNGRWTLRPTLAEGTHAITAVAGDDAGNLSGASPALSIVVDTQAPEAPTGPALASADDSGLSATDGITRVRTPTLTGTAEPGSTVTLYDGTTALDTVTVGSDGRWTLTASTPLAPGSHALTTRATDVAGNVGAASAPVTVVVDTVAPVESVPALAEGSDTGISARDGITRLTTPTLDGMAEAGATVQVFADGILLGTTTVGADGRWNLTPAAALAAGLHSITTTVTDAAGNTTATPPDRALRLTIDPAAEVPSVPDLADAGDNGESNTDNVTSIVRPWLAGTAEPGSTVTLYDGDTAVGTATADSAGHWQVRPAARLSEGTHTLTAVATDPAGNESVRSGGLGITIDLSQPTTPVLAAASDSGAVDNITNITTPTFSGRAEPGATIRLYAGATEVGTATANGSGQWTITSSPLADGSYSLHVVATSPEGDISRTSGNVSVIIDTQGPAATLASVTGPTGDDGSLTGLPTLTGTAEPGGTVRVYDGSTLLGTVVADAAGNWSFSPPALDEGTHTLAVAALDTVGNVGPTSVSTTLRLDRTPPAVSMDAAGNASRELTGTAEAGSRIKVVENGTVIGEAVADAEGRWRIPLPTLAEGTHTFTATATDAAGLVGISPDGVSLTITPPPPTTPSTPPVVGTTPTTPSTPPVVVTTPTTPPTPPVVGTTPTTPSTPPVVVTTPTTPSPPPVVVSTPTTPSPPPVVVSTPATPSTTMTPSSTAMGGTNSLPITRAVSQIAQSAASGVGLPTIDAGLPVTATVATVSTPAPTATLPSFSPSSSSSILSTVSTVAPPPVTPAPITAASEVSAIQVVAPIANQMVQPGGVAKFQVPQSAFRSTQGEVALEARQADGSPLPNWLSFDPATGTFSGSPPAGESGAVNIVVVARDNAGNEASQQFKINVGSDDGRGQDQDQGQGRDAGQGQEDGAPPPAEGGQRGAALTDGSVEAVVAALFAQPESTAERPADAPAPVAKPPLSAQLRAVGMPGLLADAADLLAGWLGGEEEESVQKAA